MKEFLRRQIKEREQKKRLEKECSMREDLELERRHLQQQQQRGQMLAAQPQHPQPPPPLPLQSKPSQDTWTTSAVNQPSAQRPPPAVSTASARVTVRIGFLSPCP